MTSKGWFHTEITNTAKKLAFEALSTSDLTNGSNTIELEKEIKRILGVETAIYTNSGTSALSMSLLSAGIGKGQTVATSGIGWIATVQAAKFTGADVLLIDVEKDLPKLDLDQLENARDKFDALISVNYNGRQLNTKKIKRILNGKVLIEDSCKSLLSRDYKGISFSGTNSNFGCFSLGMISMIPGIYGGFIVSNNLNDYDDLKCLKWHGTSYSSNKEEYKKCSYNFKTSNIHASIALGMLENYKERIAKLELIYAMYEEGLKNLENNKLLTVKVDDGEIPLLIDIVSKNRAETITKFKEKNLPTCNYHESLGKAYYTKSFTELKCSSFFGSSVFHPPCGPDQDLKAIEQSISLLRSLG